MTMDGTVPMAIMVIYHLAIFVFALVGIAAAIKYLRQ